MERPSNENIAEAIARYLDEAEFYIGYGPAVEEVHADWMDEQIVLVTNLDDVIVGRYQISVTRVGEQ
jgi:hypothetical protein